MGEIKFARNQRIAGQVAALRKWLNFAATWTRNPSACTLKDAEVERGRGRDGREGMPHSNGGSRENRTPAETRSYHQGDEREEANLKRRTSESAKGARLSTRCSDPQMRIVSEPSRGDSDSQMRETNCERARNENAPKSHPKTIPTSSARKNGNKVRKKKGKRKKVEAQPCWHAGWSDGNGPPAMGAQGKRFFAENETTT